MERTVAAVEYMGLWGEPAELPRWARSKHAPVAKLGQTAEERMALREGRAKLEGASKPKRVPLNANNREMIAAHGAGPDGATCGGCAHLVRKRMHDGEYLKCAQHGDTNGPGTDHRLKWPACGKFYARPRTMTPPTKTRGKLSVECPVCGGTVELRAWYPNDRNLVSHGERDVDTRGVFTRQHGLAVYVGADSTVTRVEVAW